MPRRHHRQPQHQPNHAAQGAGQRAEEAKNAENQEAKHLIEAQHQSARRITLSTLCFVTGGYLGGFTLGLLSRYFGASQEAQMDFFRFGATLGVGAALKVTDKFNLTPRNYLEVAEGLLMGSALHASVHDVAKAMQR